MSEVTSAAIQTSASREVTTIAAQTVAEGFMSLLMERGITQIYVNGGTDFAPIVEAYARTPESKLDFPDPIIATHENVAVGMAHGAFLVTGRPQAVMLHVSVGTANAVMGIINAARDRIPILLMAGRTPLFEHGALGARNGSIHWSQEMFDQAGMLRELVKWDYELRDGLQVEDVIDRCISIAMSEPAGPIYLSLPREVLARPLDGFSYSGQQPVVATPPFPTPASIEQLADLLVEARFPVIVTPSSGRDPSTVEALGELCERHAIGVVENFPRFVNVRADHPLHLGYALHPVLSSADVLFFIDSDVPWTTDADRPSDDCVVVQSGVDPLFSRYPIRTHRSDLTITGGSAQIIQALRESLDRRGSNVQSRYQTIADAAASSRKHRDDVRQTEGAASGPITKAFMNFALAQVFDEDMVVVNEYWASVDAIRPTLPASFFSIPPAGGLGWGLPAALGIQQHAPEKTVLAAVGDGAYIFANPVACHVAMATHHLPVLTVICNNNRWGAIEGAAAAVYPDGHFAEVGRSPLAQFSETTAFEQYAIASGGYGERVEQRSELVPALQRALRIVRTEHRQAVLNVVSVD